MPTGPARLDRFVRACLSATDSAPPQERAVRLRRGAARVQAQLRRLSDWAASADASTSAPPGLQGVTAFDLADAMEALLAAAGAEGRAPIQ